MNENWGSHFRVTDGDLIFKQGNYSEQYFFHFPSFNYIYSSQCLTHPHALWDDNLKRETIFWSDKTMVLRCVIPVVCRKTNGEVNISHENTTMVVWVCGGV